MSADAFIDKYFPNGVGGVSFWLLADKQQKICH
jgi:hypothetical protein